MIPPEIGVLDAGCQLPKRPPSVISVKTAFESSFLRKRA
jgi:hypothetical protein